MNGNVSHNVKLTFTREETGERGQKKTTPVTFDLDLAEDATLDFLYSVAETVEKQALYLLDGAKQAQYDGDFDLLASLAARAKQINDHYLTMYRAIESIERYERHE